MQASSKHTIICSKIIYKTDNLFCRGFKDNSFTLLAALKRKNNTIVKGEYKVHLLQFSL